MSLFGRRERREIAELEADVTRLRAQRDAALKGRTTAEFNREQVLTQNANLDATNRRLHGRNLELGRRLSALTEADPEYAAALERRLARALKACRRYRAALAEETRRADRLQGRLDDCLGLNSSAISDGRFWQKTRADKKQVTS